MALRPHPELVKAQSPISSPEPILLPDTCNGKKMFHPDLINFGDGSSGGNVQITQVKVNDVSQTVLFGTNVEQTFPYAKVFKVSLVKSQTVEIYAPEINPHGTYMRIWIFDQTGKEVTHSVTTRMPFVAPDSGTYFIVIDDQICQNSETRFSIVDEDQFSLLAALERVDGTRIDALHYPNGVFGRMGAYPSKYILRVPEAVSADPTSNPPGYSITYKVFDRDTGQKVSVTRHLDLFQRAVPTVEPGTSDWYFWVEPTGFENYKVPNFTVEKWGNEFQIHLTGQCCSLVANYLQPNMQYAVLLSSVSGTTLSSAWVDRFTLTDSNVSPTNPRACKADINGDNAVNLSDYSILVRNILKPIDQCQ